jgi:hypothetical protein
MKRLAPIPLLALAPPAFAHEGAHLHPHGIDAAWLVLAGTGLVVGAVAAWAVARSRK